MTTFKVSLSGLTGSVVYTDFLPDVSLEIKCDRISEVGDKVHEWLADNFLKVNKITIKEVIL